MKKIIIFLILVFLVQVLPVQAQENDEDLLFRNIDRGVNLFCSDEKITEFLSSVKKKGGAYYVGGAEGFEKGMNLYYGKISTTLADFGFGVGGAKHITYSWGQYYFGVNEVLAQLKSADDKRRLLLVLGDPFFQKFTAVKGDVVNGATMLMSYVGALYENYTADVSGAGVPKRIIVCDGALFKQNVSGLQRTPIYKKLMNGFFTNNTTLSLQAVNEVKPNAVEIYKRVFCRGKNNAN